MRFFKSFTWIKVFLSLLLIVSSILYTYLDGYYSNIKNNKILEVQKFSELKRDILTKYLLTAREDILFTKSILETFIKTQKHEEDAYINLFKISIKELMYQRKKYSQIRFLDVKGQEKIRLDFKNEIVTITKDKNLQNKKDRYYFKDSLDLKSDEIYISKFDLNIENGEIEIPHKPMIRFSTPVRNKDNKIFGYIVVNYDGTSLINELHKNTNTLNTLLLNKDSYYLLGFNKNDEWSFMFDKMITLDKQYPKLWQDIKVQNTIVNYENHIYSSIKFDPVNIISPNRSIDSKRLWYLITYINKDVINSEFTRFLSSISIFIIGILFILVFISTLVSLYIRKQNEEKIRSEISEAAFNNAEEGIFVADENARIIQVNDAFTKITGYSESDVFMKNPKVLKGKKGKKLNDYDSMWEALYKTGHWSGIFINQNKEGKDFFAKNSISTLKRDDKILYYISVFSDVTKEKEQNEKLRNTTEKLENSLEELRSAQDKIVKTEKLSALGQLIAGISHEINSPLGAIKTSSNNVLNNIAHVIKDIPKVEEILDEAQRQKFDKIKDNLPLEQSLISVKEQRALKKDLKLQIENLGIENSRYIADKLANFNISNIDEYQELLKHKEVKFIVDTLFREFVSISNLHTITRSVDRASKTIFALKKFAHFDHEDNAKLEKIKDALNSILVLFAHNLKQGIDVIKEFDDLEPIYCYPDELSQVWMNLISNSIHAMNNEGQLKINIYEEDSYQVVSINDTGGGIPKDIQEKIFEPFYTTKAAGEGSGLGLDIVKKIVEAHNGKIELNSDNIETTFKIYISKNLNNENFKGGGI